MQHPFAGLIPANPAAAPRTDFAGRRRVLKHLLVSLPAVSGLSLAGRAVLAADEPAAAAGEANQAAAYQAYLVVPHDLRDMTPELREKLQINGQLVRGYRGTGPLDGKSGWLAWWTQALAAAAAEAEKIAEVVPIDPAHKLGPDGDPGTMRTLNVQLQPNDWTWKPVPAPNTFFSTAEVVAQLQAGMKDMNVQINGFGASLKVRVLGDNVDDVVAALKRHPQVAILEWDRPITTFAEGEEG